MKSMSCWLFRFLAERARLTHSGLFFIFFFIRYFCFWCCSTNCVAVLVKSSDTLWKFGFANNFLMVPFAVLCLGLRADQSYRLRTCSMCVAVSWMFSELTSEMMVFAKKCASKE